jgi:3-deoxy-manno-octulosonate cytidylyltransferase (CMP-KDO synthetase)
MKFLGIIPARYASTRFPAKPLADLGGRPLIRWVYENTKKTLEQLVVATDHPEIEAAVKQFGGRVLMTSPDHPSGTDRCAEVVEILAGKGERYDVVLNVQGDEPFTSENHLRVLMEAFGNPDVQIATLAGEIADREELFNPNAVKVVTGKTGRALYFSRSTLPYLRNVREGDWFGQFRYLKHLGMYAYRTEILRQITRLDPGALEQAESLEQLRWLENGFSIQVLLAEKPSLGIDTPEDLERAREILSSGRLSP